tara:strand:- start:804 stop:1325 length:522 start_codon:yes stop_codon:yes gene_type:complete
MDYLVVDDYFENPKEVRKLALNATFYTKETHPGNIGNFPGYRTDYINEWNKSLYQLLLEKQLDSVKKLVDMSGYSEYWTKFSFSYTDKNVPKIEHRDFTEGFDNFKKFFGGVIYLNENPLANTGTVLTDVPTVKNVFNRYVMYDATEIHSIENSFGENVTNSRLVLTHFIYLK